MPINSLIPLQGSNPNYGGAFVAARQRRAENDRQNELLELARNQDTRAQTQADQTTQAATNRLFDERSERRFNSIVQAASELAPIVARGDEAAARSYLSNRLGTLQLARAQGVDIDTAETQEALRALDEGGLEALEPIVTDTLNAVDIMLQTRSGASQAKPSALIEQYQQARSEGFSGNYLDFVQEQSRRQVGAQYGAPTNQPGVGILQPSRIDPSQNVTLAPEEAVSEAAAARAGAERTATEQAEVNVAEAAAAPEQREKVRTLVQTIDSVDEEIEEALRSINFGTVGPIGSLTSSLPGTPARSLRNTLNTIKANLAFDRLQQMRDSSPTGGALGQVSERELSLLEGAVQTLDQFADGEDLRRRLEKVQRHYRNWKDAVVEANGGSLDEPNQSQAAPEGTVVEGSGGKRLIKRDGQWVEL